MLEREKGTSYTYLVSEHNESSKRSRLDIWVIEGKETSTFQIWENVKWKSERKIRFKYTKQIPNFMIFDFILKKIQWKHDNVDGSCPINLCTPSVFQFVFLLMIIKRWSILCIGHGNDNICLVSYFP